MSASLRVAVVVGLASVTHPGVAQQAIHTDLSPRVVRQAEGEQRYFADGRFMLLKVGPQATGANYLFMGAEEGRSRRIRPPSLRLSAA